MNSSAGRRARAEADRLRSRIEELAEDLARAEKQASRLAIAREEVTRMLQFTDRLRSLVKSAGRQVMGTSRWCVGWL
jgi:hypothetical protein